ncbi:MAG: hypothetical protein AAGC55_01115 [Myxococcota bacterium]
MSDSTEADSSPSLRDDTIERYLRDARQHRRRQLRRAGFVLVVGGLVSVGLATRMTDIGHFVGFLGVGLALWIGAAVVIRSDRRG